MKFISRYFKKSSNSTSKNVEEAEKNPSNLIHSEKDIPLKTENDRWYRSTLPKVQQDIVRIFGDNAMAGKTTVYIDLEKHVRRTGLVQITMWSSDGDAHAAGAIKVSSTEEPEIIDYINKKPGAVLKFKCFNYPEFPILYFIFGIKISDSQVATLHAVANFSDGDLQEFVLSLIKERYFIIHLFDDSFQHIKDFTVFLGAEDCDDLLRMFDSANSHYKTIPKEFSNFAKAGDRFNEEYPEDFWP